MAYKQIADQTNGFYIPCVSLFGPGCSKEIGIKAKNLGAKKALIVTDQGLFKAGVADLIAGYLAQEDVQSHIYPGAEPNPTDLNVHNGVKEYQDNGCDFIVSLGGGSAHDCGKGIGLVTAGGGHISDYEGIDKSTKPMTPLIAVNTTAGTASEMTRFCIITNTETHVKMAIVDWRCTPLIAIDDPRLMVAKPAGLTAATGMDALTHAVEAYVSTAANPITDACAEKAIRMIQQWLRQAVANGENIEAREAMSYAQYLAGMAFNNASLGYVHAMAHQLGGFYNLPHGICNAILLPHVCEFNLIACPERYADIAEFMGVDTSKLTTTQAAQAAIAAIRELSESISIPTGLNILGVKTEDFDIMATNAQKDACMLTNPRKANHAQVVEIFAKAM
ncbi:iron-containing alcohol dehydrogenase [Acinetobacter qingfengensis]|uniref:L-threonine dehydrogenase n=1 Tax=Acinetobacter qingfengensis TaxID=1262585 RepID=A0A1E7RCD8_9GAMM|nr:iron-containing alcohol dehydrogenase [Acinetobacter qingfengensis]KAA8734947.1 iron-containing alcohol dehydrogenase [Acinetobacter qingfengensis]OEY97034.1 L-threonine dehydrogenase [Acinetobacter qingfengensis]